MPGIKEEACPGVDKRDWAGRRVTPRYTQRWAPRYTDINLEINKDPDTKSGSDRDTQKETEMSWASCTDPHRCNQKH